ncbi:hypothetical protein BJY01DRAFT_61581 [Aspergillus pseudoustus]|uniref:C2H2-type domain-containing protein n=1 Tax=Aspergillus pseudoustus TaxID=1810923 RepID=A0ABR4J7V0_9EURO
MDYYMPDPANIMDDENSVFASQITWGPLNGVPQQPQQQTYVQHPGQYQQSQQFFEYHTANSGGLQPPGMTRGNSHISTQSDFSGQIHVGSQNPYDTGNIMGQGHSEMPHGSLSNNTSTSTNISHRDQRARLREILEESFTLRDSIMSSRGSDQRLLRLMVEGTSILDDLTQAEMEHAPGPQRRDSRSRKYQCFICPNGRTYQSKGTLKRHASAEHYHDIEYHCGICPPTSKRQQWLYRRDKFNDHMAKEHHQGTVNADDYSRQLPLLNACEVQGCRTSITSWEEFWEDFCQHCLISEADENLTQGHGGGRGDNGDRTNRRNGHSFQPSPNTDSFGGAFGTQPNNYGSNGGANYGGDASWVYSCNEADGSKPPTNSVGSESSSPDSDESSVPVSTAVPKPLTIRKRQKNQDARNDSGVDTVQETAQPPEASDRSGRILPKTGPHKHREASPSKDTDGKETTCEVCKHLIAGCPRCARLVGAPIRCHQCADKSCEKESTGITTVGVRLSDLPGRNLPWNMPKHDGDKGSTTFNIAAGNLTESPEMVPKHPDYSAGNNIEYTQMTEVVVSFQMSDSTTKQGTEEGSASLQKAEAPTETRPPPGLYFERYLYTRQSQGSFLQCVHETLVIPEPHKFIVSSFQGVYSCYALSFVILFGI